MITSRAVPNTSTPLRFDNGESKSKQAVVANTGRAPGVFSPVPDAATPTSHQLLFRPTRDVPPKSVDLLADQSKVPGYFDPVTGGAIDTAHKYLGGTPEAFNQIIRGLRRHMAYPLAQLEDPRFRSMVVNLVADLARTGQPVLANVLANVARENGGGDMHIALTYAGGSALFEITMSEPIGWAQRKLGGTEARSFLVFTGDHTVFGAYHRANGDLANNLMRALLYGAVSASADTNNIFEGWKRVGSVVAAAVAAAGVLTTALYFMNRATLKQNSADGTHAGLPDLSNVPDFGRTGLKFPSRSATVFVKPTDYRERTTTGQKVTEFAQGSVTKLAKAGAIFGLFLLAYDQLNPRTKSASFQAVLGVGAFAVAALIGFVGRYLELKVGKQDPREYRQKHVTLGNSVTWDNVKKTVFLTMQEAVNQAGQTEWSEAGLLKKAAQLRAPGAPSTSGDTESAFLVLKGEAARFGNAVDASNIDDVRRLIAGVLANYGAIATLKGAEESDTHALGYMRRAGENATHILKHLDAFDEIKAAADEDGGSLPHHASEIATRSTDMVQRIRKMRSDLFFALNASAETGTHAEHAAGMMKNLLPLLIAIRQLDRRPSADSNYRSLAALGKKALDKGIDSPAMASTARGHLKKMDDLLKASANKAVFLTDLLDAACDDLFDMPRGDHATRLDQLNAGLTLLHRAATEGKNAGASMRIALAQGSLAKLAKAAVPRSGAQANPAQELATINDLSREYAEITKYSAPQLKEFLEKESRAAGKPVKKEDALSKLGAQIQERLERAVILGHDLRTSGNRSTIREIIDDRGRAPESRESSAERGRGGFRSAFWTFKALPRDALDALAAETGNGAALNVEDLERAIEADFAKLPPFVKVQIDALRKLGPAPGVMPMAIQPQHNAHSHPNNFNGLDSSPVADGYVQFSLDVDAIAEFAIPNMISRLEKEIVSRILGIEYNKKPEDLTSSVYYGTHYKKSHVYNSMPQLSMANKLLKAGDDFQVRKAGDDPEKVNNRHILSMTNLILTEPEKIEAQIEQMLKSSDGPAYTWMGELSLYKLAGLTDDAPRALPAVAKLVEILVRVAAKHGLGITGHCDVAHPHKGLEKLNEIIEALEKAIDVLEGAKDPFATGNPDAPAPAPFFQFVIPHLMISPQNTGGRDIFRRLIDILQRPKLQPYVKLDLSWSILVRVACGAVRDDLRAVSPDLAEAFSSLLSARLAFMKPGSTADKNTDYPYGADAASFLHALSQNGLHVDMSAYKSFLETAMREMQRPEVAAHFEKMCFGATKPDGSIEIIGSGFMHLIVNLCKGVMVGFDNLASEIKIHGQEELLVDVMGHHPFFYLLALLGKYQESKGQKTTCFDVIEQLARGSYEATFNHPGLIERRNYSAAFVKPQDTRRHPDVITRNAIPQRKVVEENGTYRIPPMETGEDRKIAKQAALRTLPLDPPDGGVIPGETKTALQPDPSLASGKTGKQMAKLGLQGRTPTGLNVKGKVETFEGKKELSPAEVGKKIDDIRDKISKDTLVDVYKKNILSPNTWVTQEEIDTLAKGSGMHYPILFSVPEGAEIITVKGDGSCGVRAHALLERYKQTGQRPVNDEEVPLDELTRLRTRIATDTDENVAAAAVGDMLGQHLRGDKPAGISDETSKFLDRYPPILRRGANVSSKSTSFQKTSAKSPSDKASPGEVSVGSANNVGDDSKPLADNMALFYRNESHYDIILMNPGK